MFLINYPQSTLHKNLIKYLCQKKEPTCSTVVVMWNVGNLNKLSINMKYIKNMGNYIRT